MNKAVQYSKKILTAAGRSTAAFRKRNDSGRDEVVVAHFDAAVVDFAVMRPKAAVVVVGGVAELAGEGDVFVGAVLMADQVVASEEKPQAIVATVIANFEMDQIYVSLETGGFELCAQGRVVVLFRRFARMSRAIC